MSRPQAEPRSAYKAFRSISTRWSDNDAYGHVNNVVYYQWFDTAVDAWLIDKGLLDVQAGEVIGLVVETQCNYFEPLAFPQGIDAGLRVAQVGRSSVRFEVGIFAEGAPSSAARGHFVHVYVDRQTGRPQTLSAPFLSALKELQ